MRRQSTFRQLVTVSGLVFVWCALWGEASVANLASGLVLAFGIVVSGLGTAGRGPIRWRPLARFAGLVAVDLVSSTVSVAREVLTPIDRTNEAIIAVPVPRQTRAHLLLMIVSVTVTPGTAVVDADPDTGTLYLHLLHAERTEATRTHVRRLADLACQAFPVKTEEARA